MQKIFSLIIILAIVLALSSCKKQDAFTSGPVNDYYPLQVGKYITYNLDSTLFVNFGKKDTIIKYQAQDRVDSLITDNLGRPAYIIHRFIRKDAAQTWIPNNTFLIVPTANAIEFVENNLRFIKFVIPVTSGFSWKGNNYLPTNPYPSYDFASAFTENWDYTYDSVDAPLALGALTVDSTIKVDQIDESLGQDPQDPSTIYAERTYSVEKYAKGIGLIYKEFLHWEYQGESQKGFRGFGVKLTMTDHN
jgi:hypothetical protein